MNPLFATDSYKQSHREQYPTGTELVYSNLTPRSTNYLNTIEGINSEKIVNFGIQAFIKKILIDSWNKEFFEKDKSDVLEEFQRIISMHLGNDGIGIEQVSDLHDLGYLPICIRALPEGAKVDKKIPLLVIYNTKKEFYWLTNYLETSLSACLWKSIVAATISSKYREIVEFYCKQTGANEQFLDVQCHDFSARGVSGIEYMGVVGSAHLLSFIGTDTITAIPYIEKYYNSKIGLDFNAISVKATEHSTMCLNADYSSENPNELENFKKLVTEIYPNGIVSIVSDSFDYWGVISEILPSLKNEIMNREGGVPFDRVVVRPDTGNPVEVICGESVFLDSIDPITDEGFILNALELGFKYIEYEEGFYDVESRKFLEYLTESDKARLRGSIESLWNTFGGTENEKGYKTLDSHIGLIYGDSITLDRANDILRKLEFKRFASDNVVFGVGSYTYSYTTRDTLGLAVKATAGIVNGEEKNIYKEPKTDDGFKKSAKGFLKVVKNDSGDYELIDQLSFEESFKGTELRKVFEDGKLLIDESFSTIRDRLKNS